jgi:hypothetical protein
VGVCRRWVGEVERSKSSADVGLILRTRSVLDVALSFNAVTRSAAPKDSVNVVTGKHD